jgi:hypothetical protein
MKLEELIMIIGTYGGDISRWPEDRRIEAEKLLLASSEAQSALAEARELDTVLDQYVMREGDDRLSRKIVYENTQKRDRTITFYLFNPSFAIALLVLCLVFGFMVGFFDGLTTLDRPSVDSATLLLGPVDIGAI